MDVFASISMTVVWLIIFAILIIVEIATMGLTTVWFAGGAVIACILAALKLPLWVQIVGFLISSFALLFFTRPVAQRYFNKTRLRTNVEAAIGRQAIVVSEIDNLQGIGRVNLGSMEWSARTEDGSVLKPGAVVIVKRVEGNKLIVEEQVFQDEK